MEEPRVDATTVPVTYIHNNVDQVVIRITEDKLRLILGGFERDVQERGSWIAPLGICLTVVLALTTGTANDVLPTGWWLPVHGTAGLCALVWLVQALVKRNWRRKPSINAVVESIKRER